MKVLQAAYRGISELCLNPGPVDIIRRFEREAILLVGDLVNYVEESLELAVAEMRLVSKFREFEIRTRLERVPWLVIRVVAGSSEVALEVLECVDGRGPFDGMVVLDLDVVDLQLSRGGIFSGTAVSRTLWTTRGTCL